jgi:hypothetical protein
MKQSAVGSEIGFPIAGSAPMSGSSNTSIYHIPAPKPQPYYAPSTQSHVFDCGVGMQGGFDKLATSNSGNPSTASFTSINEAAESAGFQFQIRGPGEATMMDVLPEAAELDVANLWWDQNFDEYETDFFGFWRGEYPWSEGGNYFVCG